MAGTMWWGYNHMDHRRHARPPPPSFLANPQAPPLTILYIYIYIYIHIHIHMYNLGLLLPLVSMGFSVALHLLRGVLSLVVISVSLAGFRQGAAAA